MLSKGSVIDIIRSQQPRRLTTATLFLALLLLVPFSAEARGKHVDVGVLRSSLQMVQREFMYDPSSAILVAGASDALHNYLTSHGFHPTKKATETVDALQREFSQAAQEHPDLDETDMLYACLKGLVKPLDEPYTRFMTPPEFAHLQARVEGTDECGLGAHVELDSTKQLTVVEIFEHTPAAQAGLQAGDRILAIDGRSTSGIGLQEAKDLLSGTRGSEVKLSIIRQFDKLQISVVRDKTELPTVTWYAATSRVGYIRIHAFSQNVATEMDAALTGLEKAGVTAYVVDLRDNRGGYVSSAVDVCSRLLPSGSLVMSLQEKGQAALNYTCYGTTHAPRPLAVLVNERTASASEIVAGALQDHKAATLIGTRTFGKGLVQKVVPMPDGSAFAISTGRYLTPAGRDLHKRGITPEILAVQDDFHAANSDPEVKQAIALLETRLSTTAPLGATR